MTPIKVMLAAFLFALVGGIGCALWLVSPAGSTWRRKRREDARLRRLLR